MVRSLERTPEQRLAKRAESQTADEHLRRSLHHPTAGLRAASCEFTDVSAQAGDDFVFLDSWFLDVLCHFEGKDAADVCDGAAGVVLQREPPGENRFRSGSGSLHPVPLLEGGECSSRTATCW